MRALGDLAQLAGLLPPGLLERVGGRVVGSPARLFALGLDGGRGDGDAAAAERPEAFDVLVAGIRCRALPAM